MKTDDQSSQIHLERTEDKYIISKKHFKEFKRSLDALMDEFYPYPDTKFVINKSIYFDTPELVNLTQHLDQAPARHKIRIRTYAPNGIWGNDRFVEVKYKNGKETRKDRLKIGYDAYRSLMDKSVLPIDNELMILNADLLSEDEIKNQAIILNKMLAAGDSKPVIELNYKRLAYQEGDEVRVTVDEDIEVKPLPALDVSAMDSEEIQEKLAKFEAKYLNYEDFILEMKYTKKVPKWFKRKTDKLMLESERFSKYVWAMSRIGTNELKPSVK